MNFLDDMLTLCDKIAEEVKREAAENRRGSDMDAEEITLDTMRRLHKMLVRATDINDLDAAKVLADNIAQLYVAMGSPQEITL